VPQAPFPVFHTEYVEPEIKYTSRYLQLGVCNTARITTYDFKIRCLTTATYFFPLLVV
jgi:hypothetical protein